MPTPRQFSGSVPARDATPPTTPGAPDVTAIDALGRATVTVAASTDGVGVVGYDAFVDGSQVAAARSASPVIQLSGLTPGVHTVTVRAFDAALNYSVASAATTFVVPETPPDVTSAPASGETGTTTSGVTSAQLSAAVAASLTNPEYGSYRLEGGTLTIYADTSDRWRITVSEAITEIVVGLIPASTGEAWIASIEFVQDATGHAVSGWPAGIAWAGGFPPQISVRPNSVTRVGLSAFDGTLGVGWIASARPARYSSFVAVTAPADTAENTLLSIALPALEANDNLELTFAITLTGTGNKTYKIKLGATTGVTFSDAASTFLIMTLVLGNRGSVSAQWWDVLGKVGTVIISSSATSTEDTSASKTLALTVQKATGADTARLERYAIDIRKD